MKKTFLLVLVAICLTACSHDRQTDSGSGYTHSDESLEPAQTGIQEQGMSSGDPQN